MPARLFYATLLWLSDLTAARDTDDEESDRGDVPGWVMITVMTPTVR